MKRKGIREFFGIKEPFFKTDELKGNDIQRFAAREDELLDLKIAVDLNRNYAVIGETGTGKSSLLLKFQEEIKDSYYTDYLYFYTEAKTDKERKEEFFHSILSRLLIQIIANNELMNHYDPKDIYLETERLNFSISIKELEKKQVKITPEIEANFQKLLMGSILPIELNAKLQAKIGKETQKIETWSYKKHTEISLKKTIDELTRQLPAPFVLFIDEMDRIIKAVVESKDWLKEVIKILQFSTEIMTNKNLIFVFALQPEVYDIFAKADRGEGDDSILEYVPAFKKIGGFDLDFAKDAVQESLKFTGYKGTMDDLFEKDIMEIILSVVKNNPRQFMRYLTDLVSIIYKKNQHQVTMPILKEFLFEKFGKTGPEEWRKHLK
jgi:hypothetical protein